MLTCRDCLGWVLVLSLAVAGVGAAQEAAPPAPRSAPPELPDRLRNLEGTFVHPEHVAWADINWVAEEVGDEVCRQLAATGYLAPDKTQLAYLAWNAGRLSNPERVATLLAGRYLGFDLGYEFSRHRTDPLGLYFGQPTGYRYPAYKFADFHRKEFLVALTGVVLANPQSLAVLKTVTRWIEEQKVTVAEVAAVVPLDDKARTKLAYLVEHWRGIMYCLHQLTPAKERMATLQELQELELLVRPVFGFHPPAPGERVPGEAEVARARQLILELLPRLIRDPPADLGKLESGTWADRGSGVPIPMVSLGYQRYFGAHFEEKTGRLCGFGLQAFLVATYSQRPAIPLPQARQRLEELAQLVAGKAGTLGPLEVTSGKYEFEGKARFMVAGRECWDSGVRLRINLAGDCLDLDVDYLPTCTEPVNRPLLSADEALAVAHRTWLRDRTGVRLEPAELRLTLAPAEIHVVGGVRRQLVLCYVWVMRLRYDDPKRDAWSGNCYVDAETGEFLSGP